jgi:ABC-type polysaccharide/polyol phosphate transport system ATPase subunit
MQTEIVRLNNVGRKFHRFIDTEKPPHLIQGSAQAVHPNGDFWALRNIYLNINRGEIVGIVGRNGSGKSTLLNVIAGGLPASEGEVVVSGAVSALLTLGAGFQDEFTGKENIYLNASLLGMKHADIDKKFFEIVEFSELGDFINAPLGSYSAGMKMRLGFSVAIARDFDVLLTDEIISVGDIYFQKKCFEKIADFKRQNKAMLIASQDVVLIERFCDRAVLLEDGSVRASGKAAEVVEQYRALLNTKKVLSERSHAYWITETKRWAEDRQEWGTQEGTREVVLKDITVRNRWGKAVSVIAPGEKARVRVNFTARDAIDHYHFGIALFREDGVYCFGPNTQFEGLALPRMGPGDGYFEIQYGAFNLMPGRYYISAAVWDKNETFAYHYYKGRHSIEVAGLPCFGQLLRLQSRWEDEKFPALQQLQCLPPLDTLADTWENQRDSDGVVIGTVQCLDKYGSTGDTFITGRDLTIKVPLRLAAAVNTRYHQLYLWVGIFRSDRIYCHGTIEAVRRSGELTETIHYPRLPLLAGGYKVSVGLWGERERQFLAYSHGRNAFNIVSENKDHGTIYLDHRWRWHIPCGEKK